MRHNAPCRPACPHSRLAPRALILCTLALVCAPQAHAQRDAAAQWRFTLENDVWGDGSDGHYTHGTRVTRLSTQPARWLERVSARLPCRSCRELKAVQWTFGQHLYTPEATWRADQIEDDRPYAGWLFGGVRFLGGEQGPRAFRLDSIGLDVGVVGPAALAEETQTMVHDALSKPLSRGWDHQLEDELGLVLHVRREWHHRKRAGRLDNAIAPYVAGALGNVLTHLSAGLSLKTGFNFQHHRLARRAAGGGWHLFLDLETRAVARNIFLDGNTLARSHRVEKEPFIGEIRSGLKLTVGRLGIAFTAALRSREFVGQREPDRYGALSFSYAP